VVWDIYPCFQRWYHPYDYLQAFLHLGLVGIRDGIGPGQTIEINVGTEIYSVYVRFVLHLENAFSSTQCTLGKVDFALGLIDLGAPL
jgi:hypothetical protein